MKQLMTLVVVAVFCGCVGRGLYFDENGFPHGTGSKEYKYDSGNLMIKETYASGKITQTVWYRPDGTVKRQEDWKDESGTTIYLRQDGTIKAAIPFVNGNAHGYALRFDASERVTNVVEYCRGTKLNSQPTSPVDVATRAAPEK